MFHEQKFERVEERTVDSKKGTEEIRVGVDTGHGDPALNFQSTNASIVRAADVADEYAGGATVVPGASQFNSSSVRTSTGMMEMDAMKQTSHVHTEVRAPLVHPAHPVISTTSGGLAQEMAGEGFIAPVGRNTVQSNIVETTEMREMERRDKDRSSHDQELEAIASSHEKDLEKKTAKYRKETENETEKIRKELEKQHVRDVDFRKEVVESNIDRQKKEIDLEAKKAKNDLERERVMEKDALDHSKMHSDSKANH